MPFKRRDAGLGERPESRSEQKRRRMLQKLKHLTAIVDLGDEVGLPQAEDMTDLVGARGAPRLFLGKFTVEDIEEGLTRFGIPERLAERGFARVRVHTDTTDAYRHTLQFFGQTERGERLLAETALRVGCFETKAPFAHPLHGRRMRMLFILWLMMQNPLERFCPERPAWPGQLHPGLGIGRQVAQLYKALATQLGCDGIVNCPEFAHTAVLYSTAYHFLDPVAEGQLRALQRDLGEMGLGPGSWALHSGCVYREPDREHPWFWSSEEQILPLSPALKAYFASPAYAAAAEAEAERARFHVDLEKLERARPLLEDGSPREAGER